MKTLASQVLVITACFTVLALVIYLAQGCAFRAQVVSTPASVSQRVLVVNRESQEMLWVAPEAIVVLSSGQIKIGMQRYSIVSAEGEPWLPGDILKSISVLPDTLYFN